MTPASRPSAPGMTVGEAFTQAVSLLNAGKHAEARKLALELKRTIPSEADVYNLLGVIAHAAGDSTEAAAHLRKALQLKPENSDARRNLAKICSALGQWAEASVHFGYIAKAKQNSAEAQMDWARALDRAGKDEDAIAAYREAAAIHPRPHIPRTDMASVLVKMGRHQEAEAEYKSVLARAPGLAEALVNIAVLYDLQDRMDEALRMLEEAMRANPDAPEPHFHYALALLARGRLAEGWAEYAWRLRRPQSQGLSFDIPFWSGEPIKDRKLLIWTEQGPGDELLAASMIPDVLARGARCTLVCSARVARLFQRSFPNVEVIAREAIGVGANIAADFQASFSHLGLQTRPAPASFPPHTGYINADPAVSAELRKRYQGGTDCRLVGISWRSANQAAEAEKSTALAAWSEILGTPGVRFVSLQYGAHDKEIEAAKKSSGAKIIVDTSVDGLTDMDRFAAQVAAMDLVISVSSTTVHVAGSLGRPVWVLVPASKGRIWYWFLDRTDSPWYPSARLFRQSRGQSWEPVLRAASDSFKEWSARK